MQGRIVRNPDIVWREEPAAREAILAALGRGEDAGERGWVLLVDRGEMHELNLLAGEIWLLLDGTRDVPALARHLAERFDAPLAEIAADVEAFVADCEARGWVRREAA